MRAWFIYTLLTMVLWGGWGLVSKPLSSTLSPWQVQTFSTLGMVPVLVLLYFLRDRSGRPHQRRGIVLALAAGLIGSLGNVACYAALAAGGKAAAVMPLTALYPLVTIILAWVFLRERLNVIQMSGVVVSLLALFYLNGAEGSSLLSPWLAVALIPVLLWGISALLQKLSTMHASTESATFAFLLGFIPLAVVTPFLQPMQWHLSGANWGLLLVLGCLYGLGNVTLIAAYGRGGRAAIVTPLASLYSLITIPLAVWLLHEKIGGREGIGIALSLAAIVALSWEKPPKPKSAL